MATVYRNLQEQVYENAKDIENLQTNKVDSNEVVSIVSPIIDKKIKDNTVLGTGFSSVRASDVNYEGSVIFDTFNSYNDDKVNKPRSLVYRGEYFTYVLAKENLEYNLKFPTKSGTFALLEDIPANTGYIKAHTIENDAEKNYTTKIDLGSGNSGSTLHLEAPGDNGIGSIDIANEYVQGSTSIKFTADKLVFGNTEITEQQLQKLLQLIQNQ